MTAGNASGIGDGAAACVLADAAWAEEQGLEPIGRLVSWGFAGVDPSIMGIGPAPASRKALERAGLTLDDMDLVEVNEAFAPQYAAVRKELGLDHEKTNVDGGAIALTHPLAASGSPDHHPPPPRAAPSRRPLRPGLGVHRRRPGRGRGGGGPLRPVPDAG